MIRRRIPEVETPPPLVVDFRRCPAKTRVLRDGRCVPGYMVPGHCRVVGETARALIARYPAQLAAQLFPPGSELAAAGHDIGKVSPTFFEKIRRNCSAGVEDWPVVDCDPARETQWGGHAGVSQVAARAMEAPRHVPEILGEHHGFSPPTALRRADDEIFGGPGWQAQRAALVEELKRELGTDWPRIDSPAIARVVAGLVTVADWIGSGEFFEDPEIPWRDRIDAALDHAGFVVPTWREGLSFEDVFQFPPRPAQRAFIDQVAAPGVHVLEAPMGIGKTEAALYAAYRILKAQNAVGIYFALPTQLTSNKIHERVNRFLDATLAVDCSQRDALLLHGKAWLQKTEFGEEGRPGGAWFHQAKRGLLAPFGVGTIDQALMAAMRVKHGFVRAFGLAGKVVILDEVHSYDAYTSTLLVALVRLLRSLGSTVIILSATLSRARRAELLETEVTADAYPLLTSLVADAPTVEIALAGGDSREVHIEMPQEDAAALDEALRRAADGQQVLWIENTVADAQARYLDLAARSAEIGVACGLLHSRFTASDRARLEEHWTRVFGTTGRAERGESGRILVGTQVLEQSLDLDADFLVTRFAPTDMLLQRLGRLWRHAATSRPPEARAEAWILAPALAEAVEQPLRAFGATAHVYAPYVLCRSLEVWQGRTHVSLPRDIRSLIDRTYEARSEDGCMARWLHELEHGTTRRTGQEAMRRLADLTLADEGNTMPESKAQTRYSESESAEVLLLRNLTADRDTGITHLRLLDGTPLDLPRGRHLLSRVEWKRLTARLMAEQVPVRIAEAPPAPDRDTLDKLGFGNCFYLGDANWKDDESLLRVALVDATDELRGLHGRAAHDRHTLEYRNDLGYRVRKS